MIQNSHLQKKTEKSQKNTQKKMNNDSQSYLKKSKKNWLGSVGSQDNDDIMMKKMLYINRFEEK